MPESRTLSSFNGSRTKWFEWLVPKFNVNVNFDESDAYYEIQDFGEKIEKCGFVVQKEEFLESNHILTEIEDEKKELDEEVKTEKIGLHYVKTELIEQNEEVEAEKFKQREVKKVIIRNNHELDEKLQILNEVISSKKRQNTKNVFIERPGRWCTTCGGIESSCMC